MNNHRKIGDIYESKACEILKNSSYEIVKRNHYEKRGELDILAKQGNTLVVVEVKYRKNTKYGHAIMAIDRKKLRHMYQTTMKYITKNNIKDMDIRFDSICFDGEKWEWNKNIVWGDEIGF